MNRKLRRGISGSFFFSLSASRTQVVIKKSSYDNFFLFKRGVWVKSSSVEWKRYHFEQNKLSFDDFLMTTWEQENERKKEPQISRLIRLTSELKTNWPPLTTYLITCATNKGQEISERNYGIFNFQRSAIFFTNFCPSI